jgi:hypothetical protein
MKGSFNDDEWYPKILLYSGILFISSFGLQDLTNVKVKIVVLLYKALFLGTLSVDVAGE